MTNNDLMKMEEDSKNIPKRQSRALFLLTSALFCRKLQFSGKSRFAYIVVEITELNSCIQIITTFRGVFLQIITSFYLMKFYEKQWGFHTFPACQNDDCQEKLLYVIKRENDVNINFLRDLFQCFKMF